MAKNYDKKELDPKVADKQNSQPSNSKLVLEKSKPADELNRISNETDEALEHSTLSDPISNLFVDSTRNIIKDGSMTSTETLLTADANSGNTKKLSHYAQ